MATLDPAALTLLNSSITVPVTPLLATHRKGRTKDRMKQMKLRLWASALRSGTIKHPAIAAIGTACRSVALPAVNNVVRSPPRQDDPHVPLWQRDPGYSLGPTAALGAHKHGRGPW